MASRHSIGGTVLILAVAGLAFAMNAERTSAQSPKSVPKTQSQPAPKSDPEAPAQPRRIVKRGDECVRKGGGLPGVVRRDACSRWYCGKAGERDIIELNPTLAANFGCTWRLEGDRCFCRKAVAKASPDEGKKADKGKKAGKDKSKAK